MKKSLLLSLTLGALIFTGCNQSQESVKPMEKPTVSKPKIHQCDPLMEGPSWLRSGGDIDYGLGVIGVSSKATDTSTKIDIAQTDAYAKAAQQLKTEILGTVEMLRESHEGISKETFEKVFALDVKNIPISGLKQKDLYQSPCNNDFFVWMVMPFDTVAQNAKRTMKKANIEKKTIEDAVEAMNKKVKGMR